MATQVTFSVWTGTREAAGTPSVWDGTAIRPGTVYFWDGSTLILSTNTSPLDDTSLKEISLELVSTAENATKNWTSAYQYIEDINDGRGYTGGIVGWCSGTGDMLVLLQYYTSIAAGNILNKYISALQQIMTFPYAQRPAQSHTLLDPNFTTDWATAALGTPFQQAQKDERDRVYWNPALAQAKTDGLGQLGLAIYYDISVNHGPGTDSESFGGIVSGVKANGHPAPAQGGDEKAYLTAICDARDLVLQGWGDYQVDGRSSIYRKFLTDNNLTLTLPLSWSVYGDSYTITTTPTTEGGVVAGPADTTAPTVPAGLTATASGQTTVNLSWSASTDAVGVTSYRVMRNGLVIATAVTALTFNDSGLTAGTTYSYTVSAVDAAGNRSAESSTASATTTAASSSTRVTAQSLATSPTLTTGA